MGAGSHGWPEQPLVPGICPRLTAALYVAPGRPHRGYWEPSRRAVTATTARYGQGAAFVPGNPQAHPAWGRDMSPGTRAAIRRSWDRMVRSPWKRLQHPTGDAPRRQAPWLGGPGEGHLETPATGRHLAHGRCTGTVPTRQSVMHTRFDYRRQYKNPFNHTFTPQFTCTPIPTQTYWIPGRKNTPKPWPEAVSR